MLKSINPATLQVIKTYRPMQISEVNNIIDLADKASEEWKDIPVSSRSKLVMKAADVLKKNKEEYSKLMTLEMGKPIAQSRAEVEKCAWVCEYYAENADKKQMLLNVLFHSNHWV
jgi:succinate-semialdehyde dehydrogenase/glutarate-semialdehyde dehydrogenase